MDFLISINAFERVGDCLETGGVFLALGSKLKKLRCGRAASQQTGETVLKMAAYRGPQTSHLA